MSSSFSGALVEDDDAGSGPERGSWQGSSVTRQEVEWLIRTRRIPAEVSCRLPGKESSPVLNEGEYVVFMSHFARGFGLPLSDFAKDFLDVAGLESCKKWHRSFFYVKNIRNEDKIRLLAFYIGPPSKKNWNYNTRKSNALAEAFEIRLKELIRVGLH